jgi:hypothetical protein
MIANVCRVQGPMADAASRRSRRARIASSSELRLRRGPLPQGDPRVLAGPAQADPVYRPVRLGGQPAAQRVEGRSPGAAGVVRGDRGVVDGLDGDDLDEPDDGAHPSTDDDARTFPSAEGEVDGPGLDPRQLHRTDHHVLRLFREEGC